MDKSVETTWRIYALCHLPIEGSINLELVVVPIGYRCLVCGENKDKATMLLCDRCHRGWHMTCLRLPLVVLHEGNWDCPQCKKLSFCTFWSRRCGCFFPPLVDGGHVNVATCYVVIWGVEFDVDTWLKSNWNPMALEAIEDGAWMYPTCFFHSNLVQVGSEQ